MVRKIIYATLAIAIIAMGYTGFKKLNYWPRSARIFSFNSNQIPEGRTEGERGGPGNNFRPDFQSRGNRNFAEGDRPVPGNPGRDENFRRGQHGEAGRDGFRSENKINLRNVWWFLSVFAAFTVLAIYSDKALKYVVNKSRKE